MKQEDKGANEAEQWQVYRSFFLPVRDMVRTEDMLSRYTYKNKSRLRLIEFVKDLCSSGAPGISG